jgi:hypothetical protein
MGISTISCGEQQQGFTASFFLVTLLVSGGEQQQELISLIFVRFYYMRFPLEVTPEALFLNIAS